MNVVEMRPDLECEELAKALRNIADEIEAGTYEFRPSMAVVVLAEESQRGDRDGISVNFNWQTHGLGKGAGYFAAKGILAAAISAFDGPGRD